MGDVDVTLYDFFGWDKISLTDEQLSITGAGKAFDEIRDRVSKEASSLKSLVTKEWIASELGSLLKQIRLVDIFVGAWNKSRELRKYSDPKKYPPDEANFVPLVEHTITSTHHPYLEVLINNSPVRKVRLEVIVKITLQGAVLKIQGGKIKEIRSAAGRGEGEIGIEGAELSKTEPKSFSLPGVIDMGDGEMIEA
jgi:hypothetical protein